MKKPASLKSRAALAGIHVRVIRDSVWSNSPTLEFVRAHGGKVGFTDAATVTHLVTVDDPIAPFFPNNGTLTAEGFSDYVVARTHADKIGAKTCSLGDFRSMVTAIVKAAGAAEEDRIDRGLSGAQMPGFVGL